MELKTKVDAGKGKQEIVITREFDLPVHLLFKAYTEAELLEQWMGTKVLQLESKQQGAYHFETTDPMGNKHNFRGVIHEFSSDKRIVRTFEFEKMPFGVQLEFLEFEQLTETKSKLTILTLFKSVAQRDQLLQMPFAQGLNGAHNRLEKVVSDLINIS